MLDKPQTSDVIVVDKRKVIYALGICVVTLHLLNIPAVWFRSLDDPSTLQNIYTLFFAVGNEGKVPTWYSACTMFVCSILLAVIAIDAWRKKSQIFVLWAGLAVIFAYLSMDEAMQIHEMANRPVSRLLDPSGALAFGWVIPAFVFLAIFSALYLRFLFHLPERTRWLFLASGVLFLAGALGMEMVSAYHWEEHGKDLVYLMITSIEEILEMSGIALFIYSLLDHLERNTRIAIQF
jgi:hypothetical protein